MREGIAQGPPPRTPTHHPTTHSAPPCCMQPFLSRRHFYAATTFHKCIILYKNIHEVFHNTLVHVTSRVVSNRETTNVAIIYMRALLCLTWVISLKIVPVFKTYKATILNLSFKTPILRSRSVNLNFPTFFKKSCGLQERNSIGTLPFFLSYSPSFLPSIDSLLDVYYLMP